jgi:hypothetical protein
MTAKQRRFMVIRYWVGSPASGALVGPVLVATSDARHFHFWDELEAAILHPGDYEIVKVYPLGMTFREVERQFAQDFPSDAGVAWLLQDSAAPSWLWRGMGQQLGQPCLSA